MTKKRITAYILSFAAAVLLTAVAVGSGCYMGFVYEGSLIMAFSDSESFDAVRDNMLNSADYSSVPKGVDKLVIERLISKDMVRSDVTSYISDVYRGNEFEPDYKTLESNYYANMAYMLTEKNIIIDAALEKEIDGYLPVFKEFYKSQITSVSLSGFTTIRDSFGSIAKAMIIGGAVGTIAVFAVLLYAERDRKNRLEMVGIALLSAGIITILVPTYLLASGVYLNMQIWTQYMYELTVRFMRNGLVTVNFFGIAMLVCGAACGVADWLSEDKSEEKN